ncbi:unnamed protein product [Pleuronectes platessa]|uniref:Uncharacterized protein n=1 Tax=Pleuronectes platessa TaxID=8262 RepID=A0A9N7ZB19_PLEPL|nr:unnamed protein product [Pleuronectes platessa]
MFDVSYKIFCERIIRHRLLVNQEVLRMGQLRKAFTELVKANEGLDASNHRQDMLKKRLTRGVPHPNQAQRLQAGFCRDSVNRYTRGHATLSIRGRKQTPG